MTPKPVRIDQSWRCPACQTVIAYKDFDHANDGKIFPCRKCKLALVIDPNDDQPVAAKTPR